MRASIDLYLKPSTTSKDILDCFDCILRNWSLYHFDNGEHFSCFYDSDFDWESYPRSEEKKRLKEFKECINQGKICAILLLVKIPNEVERMTYEEGELKVTNMNYTGGQLLFISKSKISFISDVNTLFIENTDHVDFGFFFERLNKCFHPILDQYEFIYE